MSRRQGALCLLVAVFIWGSTFVVTQAAMQGFGPLTVVLLRFTISFVVLLPVARRRGFACSHIGRRESVLLGLTGVALFYALQNLGLAYTSAVSATLILAGIPGVTALLEAALGRSRLRPRQWLGIVLAVSGTALVSTWGGQGSASNARLGNLLIVGAVFAWALYTVLLKSAPMEQDALDLTMSSFGAGIVAILPWAAIEMAITGLPRPGLSSGAALLYLSLASSGLTMWLWSLGTRALEASTAATFTNLVPVTGLLVALLSGDRLTPLPALGGALALVGVWLSASARERARHGDAEV